MKTLILPLIALLISPACTKKNNSELSNIAAPGPRLESNRFYRIDGETFYRSLCSKDVTPTTANCQTALRAVPYSGFKSALLESLKQDSLSNSKALAAETLLLQEADAGTVLRRQEIAKLKGELSSASSILSTTMSDQANNRKSLEAVNGELATINTRIANASGPERERLVEVQAGYIQEQTGLLALIERTKVDIEAKEQLKRGIEQNLAAKNQEITTYLAGLVVNSPLSEELTTKKNLLAAETSLFEEAESRLKDPITFPLNLWNKEGAKELVERFDPILLTQVKPLVGVRSMKTADRSELFPKGLYFGNAAPSEDSILNADTYELPWSLGSGSGHCSGYRIRNGGFASVSNRAIARIGGVNLSKVLSIELQKNSNDEIPGLCYGVRGGVWNLNTTVFVSGVSISNESATFSGTLYYEDVGKYAQCDDGRSGCREIVDGSERSFSVTYSSK